MVGMAMGRASGEYRLNSLDGLNGLEWCSSSPPHAWGGGAAHLRRDGGGDATGRRLCILPRLTAVPPPPPLRGPPPHEWGGDDVSPSEPPEPSEWSEMAAPPIAGIMATGQYGRAGGLIGQNGAGKGGAVERVGEFGGVYHRWGRHLNIPSPAGGEGNHACISGVWKGRMASGLMRGVVHVERLAERPGEGDAAGACRS
jgi:hypothetical protein